MGGDSRNRAPDSDMLLGQFLSNAKAGDCDAGFDIARIFLGEVPSGSAELILTVAEALILQSAQLGSDAAKDYLANTWPQMRSVLQGRYARKGLKD
jgi:hypothetical protein